MMIALLILAIVHPGRTLVGVDSHFPRKTRAEKRAEKATKKEEKLKKKNDRKLEKLESQIKKEELKMEKDERKARNKDQNYDAPRVEGGIREILPEYQV